MKCCSGNNYEHQCGLLHANFQVLWGEPIPGMLRYTLNHSHILPVVRQAGRNGVTALAESGDYVLVVVFEVFHRVAGVRG